MYYLNDLTDVRVCRQLNPYWLVLLYYLPPCWTVLEMRPRALHYGFIDESWFNAILVVHLAHFLHLLKLAAQIVHLC